MRHCESCNMLDGLLYDMSQPCTCTVDGAADGYLIGETQHDPTKHNPGCSRLRHLVTPYRKQLRRYRTQDGVSDDIGVLDLPDEYGYLKKHGFVGRVHSGYLWSEKLLCRQCIIDWEQRQTLKKDYDARCAAMKSEPKDYAYDAAICF